MLRIAMVADRTHSNEGAVVGTRQVAALSDALVAAGHDVTLYEQHDTPTETASTGDRKAVHIPVSRFTVKRAARPTGKVATDLAGALAQSRPDVVHTHGGPAGLEAVRVAAELGIPVVHSVPVAERATPPAARFIATSTAHRADLISCGVPRQRIDVVPAGVDIDRFTPEGPAAPRTMRHRLVAVGRMTPSAGFGTAIATLPALSDTELVIAGGPTDGTHAGQLRRYATTLGVADRLRMAGPVAQLDLPGLLRSADVAVCTPWDTTADVAVVEAMACGVAVVASTVGDLNDAVVDKVTGVLVPPRKPRALAAVLRHLLAHAATCDQYGAAGRDRAWARYSWTRIATETVHSYHRAGVVDPIEAARDAAVNHRKRGHGRADPAPAAQL